MARDIYEDYDALDQSDQKDGVATALCVITTLVLLLAVYMIQSALADHFNEGMLADKSASAGT